MRVARFVLDDCVLGDVVIWRSRLDGERNMARFRVSLDSGLAETTAKGDIEVGHQMFDMGCPSVRGYDEDIVLRELWRMNHNTMSGETCRFSDVGEDCIWLELSVSPLNYLLAE